MRKTLKYLFLLLLFMLLLICGVVYYLLYTTSGSQRTLDYLISARQLPLSYQSLDGHLAGELMISGVQFNDPALDVEVNQLAYQLQWSWWHRSIKVQNLDIDGVRIKQTPNGVDEDQPLNLPAMDLPLTLQVESFRVTDIWWQSQGDDLNLQAVSGQLSWQGDDLKVGSLSLTHPQLSAELTGQIRLSSEWPLAASVVWQWSEGSAVVTQLSGESQISGDLKALAGRHDLVLNLPEASGELLVNTQLTLDHDLSARLELSTDDHLLLSQSGKTVRIDFEHAMVSGNPDQYVFDLAARLNHPDQPAGHLRLSGTGNAQQVQIDALQLTAADQVLQAEMVVGWAPHLSTSGSLKLAHLNPATWGLEHAADVNGQMRFAISQPAEDWQIKVEQIDVTGHVQNRALDLTGGVQWLAGQYQANDLSLSLGENRLNLNGQVNQDTVDATIDLHWPDLAVLDETISGGIKAAFEVSGEFDQPFIQGQFEGTDLRHKQLLVSAVSGSVKGELQQSLEVQFTVDNLTAGTVQVAQLNAGISGWLDDHELVLTFDMEDTFTRLNLHGQYGGNNTDVLYQGVVNQHEVTLSDGRQVVLNQPMQIRWGDVLMLSEACWKGVNAGQLCVRSDQISADEPLTGEMSVQAFSTAPFAAFLPERLQLRGLLNGQARYRLDEGLLWLESAMELSDGLLRHKTLDDEWLELPIEVLQLGANTSQHIIDLTADLRLADDSFLQWQSSISRQENTDPWTLDALISGQLNSPELITAMTAEVSEARGVVEIQGSVSGTLTAPVIRWQLSQPDGHLKLTRMGSRIEQSVLQIETQRGEQLVYDIHLTGVSQSDRKQGLMTLKGALITQPQWQFSGQLSGQDFRVLNLPELTLDVSPELKVEASQAQASITGELAIPYGHVLIKTLPPGSVGNSRDLVVIRDEEPDVDERPFPVLLNINARIEDRVELDVIGLTSGLAGTLNLRQAEDQQLKGFGELNLLDGQYEIYGQALSIETGTLNFAGALDNPRLNVIASRQATSEAVKAGVKLGGTVNQLQSELYSEPPMQDVEKLSYIMTGQGLEGAGNLDSEALKQAAIVLGLNQSSPVFRQIQQQFGIDVLTVKRNGDQSESVIEAGKKINDDLYIAYNQGLFNRLGFWVLKYRINEYLNLQTTQGEDQSIDLVYTRKSEPPRAPKK